MKVISKRERLLRIGGKGADGQPFKLYLYPGSNIIGKDDEAKLKDHPDFKAQIEAGKLSIEESGKSESKPKETTPGIGTMSVKDAKKVIEACDEVDELKVMKKEESQKGDDARKAIIEAIDKQLKKIGG